MIREALSKLNKQELIKKIVATGDYKKASVDTAFSRGQIPKNMAAHMEEFTSISVKFWLLPETYDTNGKKR